MNCVGAVVAARRAGTGKRIVTVLCDSGSRGISRQADWATNKKRTCLSPIVRVPHLGLVGDHRSSSVVLPCNIGWEDAVDGGQEHFNS